MSAVDQTDPGGEVGYPEARGVDVGQPDGTLNYDCAGARHSSANEPWPSMKLIDMTVVPRSKSTSGPTALTTPVTSWPGVKAPDGVSGYV